MAGRTDAAAGPAGGPADTAAESVGGRAAVVGSVTAVAGMADRPEESVGSEIPTGAQAGALELPVPSRGQAARWGDSIPANRRARAPVELSLAPLCLANLSASATDVGLVEYGHRVCAVGDQLARRFGKHLVESSVVTVTESLRLLSWCRADRF